MLTKEYFNKVYRNNRVLLILEKFEASLKKGYLAKDYFRCAAIWRGVLTFKVSIKIISYLEFIYRINHY